jgi:hypothetical protein
MNYAYPVEAGGALGYDPLKIAARVESVTYSDFYENTHTYEFRRIRRTYANRIGMEPVAAMVDATRVALRRFGRGAPPDDDISLVGIEFK